MKKKINIEYEIEVPNGTPDDAVTEIALALVAREDNLADWEFVFDEVYDMINYSEPIIKINDKKLTETSENFYEKYKDEFNKKYGY